jgi:hypothetical protein
MANAVAQVTEALGLRRKSAIRVSDPLEGADRVGPVQVGTANGKDDGVPVYESPRHPKSSDPAT